MLKTHIAFCIDESGSVYGIVKPLIEAYNKNVEAIRESVLGQGQEATMTALVFGDRNVKHRALYIGQQVQTVTPLKDGDIRPSGMTPLFDSVFRAIKKLEEFDDGLDETTFVWFLVIMESLISSFNPPAIHEKSPPILKCCIGPNSAPKRNNMKVHDCVGCGYCCMKTPCDVARRLYPGVRECPQLLWNDKLNRYECGLMLLPGDLGAEYRKQLYAGMGCCSSLNSWRKDVRKRISTTSEYEVNPLPIIFQKFLTALSREFMSGDKMSLILGRFENDLIKSKYSKDEINNILKSVCHIFNENRSSFIKEFMG